MMPWIFINSFFAFDSLVRWEMLLKKLKFYIPTAACCLLWSWLAFFHSIAYAEDSFSESSFGETSFGQTIDCTDVSIDFMDDLSLTPEERIRLMDEAFFNSLNRFELCESAKQMAASSGETASDGNGAETGAETDAETGSETGSETGAEDSSTKSTGDSGGSSTEASVAGSTMSGTETAEKDPAAGGAEPRKSDDLESSANQNGLGKNGLGKNEPDKNETGKNEPNKNETDKNTGSNMSGANGKPPEDIPSAQNDDALAAQIRYAAENETDPLKSRQLWNEYRKYKGLPIK
jgi:hypothetical protein